MDIEKRLNNSRDFVVNVTTVISDIVRTIENSKLTDSNSSKLVSVAMKNTIDIISILTENVAEINISLRELDNISRTTNMTYILGDPVSIVKALKGEKIDKTGPFMLFASLLNIAGQISSTSENIDKRSLKNSKDKIKILINAAIYVYQELYKNILYIKLFSGKFSLSLIQTFGELTNTIVNILFRNLSNIAKLTTEGIDKKNIRRSISTVFSIYHSILWNIFKLGLTISIYSKIIGGTSLLKHLAIIVGITSYLSLLFVLLKVVIDQSIILGKNFIAIKLGIVALKDIYISLFRIFLFRKRSNELISDIKRLIFVGIIVTEYSMIFRLLEPVINKLITLGQNFAAVTVGIHLMSRLFYDKDSLLSKFKKIKGSDISKLVIALEVASMLHIIFLLLGNVIDNVIKAGKNSISFFVGVLLINRIFNRRTGLVGIIIKNTKGKLFNQLKAAVPAIAMLSLIMLLLNNVINTLIIAGKNWRRVKRGTRAVDYVLSHINGIMVKFNKIPLSTMKTFLSKIALLSLAFIPVSVMMSILGAASIFAIPAILSIAAITIVVSSVLLIIYMLNNVKQKSLQQGLSKILMIVSSMLAAGGSLAIISTLDIDFLKIIAFIGVFVLFMSAATSIAYLLSKLKVSITIGTLVMLALVSSLYIAALIVERISMLNIHAKNIGQFVLALAGIIGIALLIAISIVYVPIAILGVAALLILVTSLFVIALELKLLSELDLGDISNASVVAQQIFVTCNEIIKMFLLNTIGTPKSANELSWGQKLMKYIGGPIVQIVEAIFSAMYIAMIFITITFILIIAAELTLLGKLDMPSISKQVYYNVNTIMNISNFIIDTMFGGKQTKEGYSDAYDKLGIFGPIINFACPPLVPILEGLFAVLNIALIFISVSFILLIATELRILQEIKLDEHLIKRNISKVINCAQTVQNVLRATKHSKETKKQQPWWRRALGAIPLVSNITDLVEAIMNIGSLALTFISIGLITAIAKNLEYLQEIKLDSDSIRQNVTGPQGILTIANQLVTDLENTKTSSISEKKVKSFGTYVDDSVKLMQQINKLDTDKLIKYSDMWGKMTEFMDTMKDVHIEELADAIVNKIAPAMSDISDNVDKISNTSPSNQSVSIAQPNPSTAPSSAVGDPTSNKVTNLPEPIDYTDILQGIKSAVEDILQQRMMG